MKRQNLFVSIGALFVGYCTGELFVAIFTKIWRHPTIELALFLIGLTLGAVLTALAFKNTSPVQQGHRLRIFIQRIGRESDQGIGYLEDGSMVVVNGGAAYLNQEVATSILSIKHSAAGRLIFCNLQELYVS